MTQEQWQSILARDRAADGRFLVGVTTTKCVCLPSCPSRLPSPAHVRIFPSLEAALAEGYRPCSRCRPDLPGWEGPRAELARSAAAYIEEHYAEKFSLQRMAAALFVNGNYLLRTFRAETGETLLERHNRTRCRHAAALLEEPGHSVAWIGDAVGFGNASHFTRVFRSFYGATPSAYRAAHFASFRKG